jgi:3-oxoadipate enol-lactonase
VTVELHFQADGPADGPVVVLSGALGSTVDMWQPQLPALVERFRVIRIDHRGHGRSPVATGPYRISDLGGDALALLDSLGADRVAWCGLSMGGMVGMWLATEAPERIGSLVLCCTSAGFPDRGPWRDRIAAVRAGGTASIAEWVVQRWFTPDYAEANPDPVAAAQRWVADTPDDGYLACCQAIEAWDHIGELGRIAAPTLLIAGAHDTSTPIDPHARTLAEHIPGAQLAVVDAAHVANIEAAADVNRLIVRHLS